MAHSCSAWKWMWDLGCDFYCFSGHKVYFSRHGVCTRMRNRSKCRLTKWVVEQSKRLRSKNRIRWRSLKYEAGTLISKSIGLGFALDYVINRNRQNSCTREWAFDLCFGQCIRFRNTFIGEAKNHWSYFICNRQDSPIRYWNNSGSAGCCGSYRTSCTQPLMNRYCIPGTVRVSFALYNTKDEVDVLVVAWTKLWKCWVEWRLQKLKMKLWKSSKCSNSGI